MTGEEKRNILKEQYKRDLQKRKEFLENVKNLRHQNNINKALGEMLEGMNDDSDDWINQLNQETALSEAKFEMALDQATEAEQKLENIAKEAEMQRINAENLVEQMKRDMGLLPEEAPADPVVSEENAPSASTETESVEESSNEDSSEEPPAPLPPEKTMGDF